MLQLQLNQVEISFQSRLLFSLEQLTFAQGQTIHLQGENGSGKSTLMKLMAGLIKPTSGHITIKGNEKISPWCRNPLLGQAVYLHQHPYLFEGDVMYNLTYTHPFNPLNSNTLTQVTEQAIELAKLGHLLNQQASDLSGGERQRLAIARAWIMRPKLLMLDEPTSNMDSDSQKLVLTMIKQLQKQGTGLLLSSHQSCSLTQLCNQRWKIAQQRIQSITTSANMTTNYHHATQEINHATAI